MRYWDASALAPIAVEEPGTPLVRGWLKDDPDVATWAWTQVELIGSIERRFRGQTEFAAIRRRLLEEVGTWAATWHEITDLLPVRTRAKSLLARHPLRAADAAQLAAAMIAAENDPASLEFVCLDRPLARAADLEGFRVLTWPE